MDAMESYPNFFFSLLALGVCKRHGRPLGNTDLCQSGREFSVKRAHIGSIGQAAFPGLLYDSIDNVRVSVSEVNHSELRNHVNVCFAIGVCHCVAFGAIPNDL